MAQAVRDVLVTVDSFGIDEPFLRQTLVEKTTVSKPTAERVHQQLIEIGALRVLNPGGRPMRTTRMLDSEGKPRDLVSEYDRGELTGVVGQGGKREDKRVVEPEPEYFELDPDEIFDQLEDEGFFKLIQNRITRMQANAKVAANQKAEVEAHLSVRQAEWRQRELSLEKEVSGLREELRTERKRNMELELELQRARGQRVLAEQPERVLMVKQPLNVQRESGGSGPNIPSRVRVHKKPVTTHVPKGAQNAIIGVKK